MRCWQSGIAPQHCQHVIFFELMVNCLLPLLIYKPIFPYILVALQFLDYPFAASFYDFYLLELTSDLGKEELQLFR